MAVEVTLKVRFAWIILQATNSICTGRYFSEFKIVRRLIRKKDVLLTDPLKKSGQENASLKHLGFQGSAVDS